MEPENHPCEKEKHLPNLNFWFPCQISGVYDCSTQLMSHHVFEKGGKEHADNCDNLRFRDLCLLVGQSLCDSC